MKSYYVGHKIKLTLLTVLVIAINIFAQSGDVTGEPGYVDFGDFSAFENSTGVTEVILDQDLLSILAEISTDEDPNIMSILNGLKLVTANIYKVNEENSEAVNEKIQKIDSKLSADNWKRIVKTKDDTETANVYIKQNQSNRIVGLVVTTFNSEGEAAFVNIVGEIDLKNLGKLGNKFNIPHLNDVNHDDNEN